VYNPNSGKRRNVKGMIEHRLKEANIPFEFLESKGVRDTWEIANKCDIDQYSILVACGGDGTSHEVVNGLLFREDKKRVPVAFIPNGTGNDFCDNLTITNIEKALDFIIKGDVVKIDVQKVLLDYENEESIPHEIKDMKMRY
jgi:diacylglycerol kinase family enzyme